MQTPTHAITTPPPLNTANILAPHDVGLWGNLGVVYRQIKRHQSAINCYQRALQIKPGDIATLGNLANALKDLRRLDEAIAIHAQVVKQIPDDVKALMNYAVALRENGDYEQALEQLDFAQKLKPEDAGIEWERSQSLLYLGRYEEGFKAYEARKRTGDLPVTVFAFPEWLGLLAEDRHSRENGNPETQLNGKSIDLAEQTQETTTSHRHSGESRNPESQLNGKSIDHAEQIQQTLKKQLNGKTILIHTEQGYGDTILAARFIPQIKALVGSGKAIFQCKPELHRLFKNVGADLLIKPDELPDPSRLQIDYHVSLMSLFGALGVTPETIPPPATLHIPIEAKKKFAFLARDNLVRHSGESRNPEQPNQAKQLSELINAINQSSSNKIIKVGIVWTGSLTFNANDQRRLPLTVFLPLAEQPNLRLYSLQKGPAVKELYATGADAYIQDIGKLCEDFADTAAAIEQMDVIVMTDSSVAHLTGSLNKRVINLLNDRPYWLYTLEQDKTPWYPRMEFVHKDQIERLVEAIVK